MTPLHVLEAAIEAFWEYLPVLLAFVAGTFMGWMLGLSWRKPC